ncbi:hypothetical protein BC830DRAFT_219903, partial [Chytriomyces sp. MP71]
MASLPPNILTELNQIMTGVTDYSKLVVPPGIQANITSVNASVGGNVDVTYDCEVTPEGITQTMLAIAESFLASAEKNGTVGPPVSSSKIPAETGAAATVQSTAAKLDNPVFGLGLSGSFLMADLPLPSQPHPSAGTQTATSSPSSSPSRQSPSPQIPIFAHGSPGKQTNMSMPSGLLMFAGSTTGRPIIAPVSVAAPHFAANYPHIAKPSAGQKSPSRQGPRSKDNPQPAPKELMFYGPELPPNFKYEDPARAVTSAMNSFVNVANGATAAVNAVADAAMAAAASMNIVGMDAPPPPPPRMFMGFPIIRHPNAPEVDSDFGLYDEDADDDFNDESGDEYLRCEEDFYDPDDTYDGSVDQHHELVVEDQVGELFDDVVDEDDDSQYEDIDDFDAGGDLYLEDPDRAISFLNQGSTYISELLYSVRWMVAKGEQLIQNPTPVSSEVKALLGADYVMSKSGALVRRAPGNAQFGPSSAKYAPPPPRPPCQDLIDMLEKE